MKATKTQKTCDEYIMRASSIIKIYNTANKKTGIDFGSWLRIYIAPKVARTWTTYRAALIHAIEQKKVQINNITHSESLNIILNLKNIKTKKRMDSKATSRLKYKHLPLELYEKLKKELLVQSASRYDMILFHWLRATRATGLRPHEWTTLSIRINPDNKNQFILIVQNGKHTNNRSFGPERKLYISAEQNIIKSIMITWKTLKENYTPSDDRVHERFYKACRDRLRWVNARIGCKGKKKRITIYSARHQFKADMQLKRMSDDEIAALMGHGSIATANINYAKKRFARETTTTIKPSNSDLKKVIELNKDRVITTPPYLNSQTPEIQANEQQSI